MQYILCPRCSFKVPLKKHLCITCGYVLPKVSPAVNDEPAAKAQRSKLWQMIGNIVRETEPSNRPEPVPTHEEPVLG